MNLFYLFGILDSKNHEKGIVYNQLSAAYELVPAEEFGQESIQENLKNMDWVNEKVIHHQKVVDQLSTDHNVIPLKFGSLFKTKESVQNMLKDRSDQFIQLLSRFDGKKEWGLKLFYSDSNLQSWLISETNELSAASKQLDAASAGSSFLLKKKIEEKLKEAVKTELNNVRTFVYDKATETTNELHVQSEQDQSLSERKEKNFLNLAMLLDQEERNEFNAFLEIQQAQLEPKGIIAELTGPWPPYSFVSNG